MKALGRTARWLARSGGTFAAATAIALSAASSLGDGDSSSSAVSRRAAVADPAPALEASAEAPADLEIEVNDAPGGVIVRATRPGYLVALLGARARVAAERRAELTIDRAAFVDEPARASLARGGAIAWETSAFGDLRVERGVLAIAKHGDAWTVTAKSAEAPATRRWSGAHHTCDAHADPFGGYAVLCRLDKASRDVAAASTTSAWPRDDVLVSRAGAATIVRLDLPLTGPDDAPIASSAVASFHVGRTGFVIDVDATKVPGEPRAIALGVASREQPVATDEEARIAAELGNNSRAVVSARTR